MLLQPPGERLRERSPSEFLATHHTAAPVVDLAAPIWRFEPISSGPLAERFTQVTKPRQLTRVRAAVAEAALELWRLRAAHRAVAARLPDAPPWQTGPQLPPAGYRPMDLPARSHAAVARSQKPRNP